MISDGQTARVGSLTANAERFMPWRTTDGATVAPKGTLELPVLVEGVMAPERFLALLRDFVVFGHTGGGLVKIIAGYHQLHAVVKAVETTLAAIEPEGDRRAALSRASGGVVFTTIQKFSPAAGEDDYPLLTYRRNVVVITDEAHRSQCGFRAKVDAGNGVIGYGFAKYLRDALPNASFIGFTGTRIEQADVNTPAVFGDYIDVYDISRAVEDGATVPIRQADARARPDAGHRAREPGVPSGYAWCCGRAPLRRSLFGSPPRSADSLRKISVVRPLFHYRQSAASARPCDRRRVESQSTPLACSCP